MPSYYTSKINFCMVAKIYLLCTYIHLVARGTVDEKIMKALRDKANLAKALVDEYRAGANPFN